MLAKLSSADKFAQMRAIKRLESDCSFVPRKLLYKNLPWPLPFAVGGGQVTIFGSSINLKRVCIVCSVSSPIEQSLCFNLKAIQKDNNMSL